MSKGDHAFGLENFHPRHAGLADRCGGLDADALLYLVKKMSPHVRSLCVALCPPGGPLRLRPGEAGSAALAGLIEDPCASGLLNAGN